ncbi:hypothetical protein AB6D11_03135 [Vibrio splendidus]
MSKRTRFTISLDPNLPMDLAIIEDIKKLPAQSHRRASYIRSLLVLGHQWNKGEREINKTTVLAGITDETRPFLSLLISMLESERSQSVRNSNKESTVTIASNREDNSSKTQPINIQEPITSSDIKKEVDVKLSEDGSSYDSVSNPVVESSRRPEMTHEQDADDHESGLSYDAKVNDQVDTRNSLGQDNGSINLDVEYEKVTSTQDTIIDENSTNIKADDSLSLEDIDEPDALLLLQQKLT